MRFKRIYTLILSLLIISAVLVTDTARASALDPVGAGEIGGLETPEATGEDLVSTESTDEAAAPEDDTDGETESETESETEFELPTEGVNFDITTTDMYHEHPAILALEERMTSENLLYAGVAICTADNYVNIRKAPDATAEIYGKIYNNCAAYIDDTVTNEAGEWYRIHSGTVEGYIKAEYFAVGDEAKELAGKAGTVVATIKVESLRLRDQPSLEGNTITLVSADERYTVTGESGDFIRLSIDDDLEGYVLKDYVSLSVKFKEAISIAEEQAEIERLARLERLRREAEEQASREAASRAASKAAAKTSTAKKTTKSSDNTKSTTKSSNSTKSSTKATTKATKPDSYGGSPGSNAGSVSSTRWAICAFAESYVGQIPYVYGGSSLSSGVDCSGFVQQVFKNYGISLPRTSDSQGYSGKSVSVEDMRPGDIIYYGGHVAIYIGDGTVVHASNKETGIKYSTWNYRTVKGIRNVLGD